MVAVPKVMSFESITSSGVFVTMTNNPGKELKSMESVRTCRIVAELDALQAEVAALKRLQAATAAELDALLPAILDRVFKGEL
jgi:type I restriction enzyme S subunit